MARKLTSHLSRPVRVWLPDDEQIVGLSDKPDDEQADITDLFADLISSGADSGADRPETGSAASHRDGIDLWLHYPDRMRVYVDGRRIGAAIAVAYAAAGFNRLLTPALEALAALDDGPAPTAGP